MTVDDEEGRVWTSDAQGRSVRVCRVERDCRMDVGGLDDCPARGVPDLLIVGAKETVPIVSGRVSGLRRSSDRPSDQANAVNREQSPN